MISSPAITAITTRAPRLLAPLIAVLALADGVLHLALDVVLFHGTFFGSGAPAGSPPGVRPDPARQDQPRARRRTRCCSP
jgi:hypothetical protein